MRKLWVVGIWLLLVALTIGAFGCVGGDKPYPEANLKLLGLYETPKCGKAISTLDFTSTGRIGTGFPPAVLTVCIKNSYNKSLQVTASLIKFDCGTVSLEPTDTQSQIDPGKTGTFYLRLAVKTDSQCKLEPNDYQFWVAVKGEEDGGGSLDVVYPARLEIRG
jgi:hypothetical protein